jgi:hypothetical protein
MNSVLCLFCFSCFINQKTNLADLIYAVVYFMKHCEIFTSIDRLYLIEACSWEFYGGQYVKFCKKIYILVTLVLDMKYSCRNRHTNYVSRFCV